jgi:hypothetical protein
MLVGLNGISPRDELEGMMVAQLITAHNAVMDCYRRAAIPEQHAEARRENLAQAGKLSRTFAMLLEVLNRTLVWPWQQLTPSNSRPTTHPQAALN